MAGGDHPAEVVELESRAEPLAHRAGDRVLVAVAVREVEHAIGHERGRAVGPHVAEPDRQMGARLVDRDLEIEFGRSDQDPLA